MSCPKTGPCLPFIDVLSLCCVVSGGFPDPCLVEGQPIDPQKIEDALQAASELMWSATGRKFGLCEITIRPCKKTCNPCPDSGYDFFGINGFGWGGFPWTPHFERGIWTNVVCGQCPGECGCTKLCQIELPYPVCTVDEVKLDGVVVNPDEYRVDEFKYLVSTPAVSGTCWPTCQDLELEDTEPGTFSVTVTYGREVPQLIKLATAELACQLLKACVGAPCQLPQRISSFTRQGISVGFLDTMSFLEAGRTGIYIVDLAINTFNPRRLQKNASVFSIDNEPKWRRTGT